MPVTELYLLTKDTTFMQESNLQISTNKPPQRPHQLVSDLWYDGTGGRICKKFETLQSDVC